MSPNSTQQRTRPASIFAGALRYRLGRAAEREVRWAAKFMNDLVEGGVYAQKTGLLRWSVFKILKLDPEVAHLRLYGNRFWRRPTENVLAALDWSVGHMPISRASVATWSLHLISLQPVGDDELEGYNLWKDDPEAGAFV